MEIKIEITCSCGRKSIVNLFSGKKEYACETCGVELFKAHITNGYVYVLSNPTMPGLLKIGYTDREVDERVEELNSTGVPVPFEVEAIFGSPNAYEDEQAIHSMLAQHRLANNREFFSVDIKETVQCIIDYIGSEPNFLKSPDLLMTGSEKQALRELKIQAEEQKRADEQARCEQEIKEREQRQIEDRKREIVRNKGFRKLMIEQIRASDPLLAREVQLRYEAELKNLGVEFLEEYTSGEGVP
ncbi:MAG: GIY-YIG nuclease family protein [Kiritimatiellales bacterium]